MASLAGVEFCMGTSGEGIPIIDVDIDSGGGLGDAAPSIVFSDDTTRLDFPWVAL